MWNVSMKREHGTLSLHEIGNMGLWITQFGIWEEGKYEIGSMARIRVISKFELGNLQVPLGSPIV